MRMEQVIGDRLAELRAGRRLTQEQLGQRIGEALGRSWSRQMVWAAEHGQRSFTAVELVAMARALDAQVTELMTPDDTSDIELGEGASLSRDDVVRALYPSDLLVKREDGSLTPMDAQQRTTLPMADLLGQLVRQGQLKFEQNEPKGDR